MLTRLSSAKLKPRRRQKILAIDPGTRYMGVALLENGALIYHGVKEIKQRKSPQEVLWAGRKIVLRMINDFRPQTMVIEKAFYAKNRNAALLYLLAKELQAVGRRKGLRVVSFAPCTVKKAICGHGRAGKKDVARVVVARYPCLKVYLTQDKAWKERYHQNAFDALALGLMVT